MTLLALIATAYGLVGAASSLLEAARLVRTDSADEISLGFLGMLLGGYLVWLGYGISAGDDPLIITDAVGLVAGTITLSIAVQLQLRHGASPSGHIRDHRSTASNTASVDRRCGCADRSSRDVGADASRPYPLTGVRDPDADRGSARYLPG